MVRLGNVWDSTTEVLSGRGGMLAGIAALAIVLAGVVSNAVSLLLTGSGVAPSPGLAIVAALVAFVAFGFTVWGQLAITAAATDPAVMRRDAFAIALRRLPVAIGVYLVLGLLLVVLALPIVIAILSSGIDFTQPGPVIAQSIPAGTRSFVALYAIVLLVAGIWLSARLFLLNPVIVNERSGLRAPQRSFTLTRGLVWRIIGFTLLAGIVGLVAILATQLIVGLVLRLLLGADSLRTVAFLTGIVTQIATALYVVVVATFAAQFYVAVSGRADDARLARTFE